MSGLMRDAQFSEKDFYRKVGTLFKDKFGGPSNLNSNSIAIIEVPTGLTYYGFDLYITDAAGAEITRSAMTAEIGDVRVVVNGETFINLSLAEIHSLNDYYLGRRGASLANSIAVIDLCERHLRDPLHSRALAWGTADVQNLRIELELGTLSSVGIVNFHARYDADKNRPLGYHKKILRHEKSFASTGEHEVSDLIRNPSRKYRAMHIKSGTISDVTLTLDNEQVIDHYKRALLHREALAAERIPQTGYTHLEFNPFNELRGGLDMVKMNQQGQAAPIGDMRLTPNFYTAPNSYRIITEHVEEFGPR